MLKSKEVLSISVKILAGLSVMTVMVITSFSDKFITEFYRFVGFVDIRRVVLFIDS